MRAAGIPTWVGDLKNAFVEAGFVDVGWSASFDVFSTPEDAAFFHAFVNEWFLSDEVIDQATQAGLATREQFETWRADMDKWDGHPGAVSGLAFGEAIGFKP